MLGSLLLYLKGMRIMMFQLSGFYYITYIYIYIYIYIFTTIIYLFTDIQISI